LHLHIFRKDPVQNKWEVWGELCDGPNKGQKLKIYVDNKRVAKLKRRNEYFVKIKNVFTHHILIYKTVKRRSPEIHQMELEKVFEIRE
jgi:hypothetical protein